MNTKTAKDYLVEQITEQAARENLPLSDIEKKMMYFTESDPLSCENPLEINEEFERQYDNAEYETKMSRLLHGTYERLKSEDPERKRNWDEAIKTLRKGDHYFLVLWDLKPQREPSRYESLKVFVSALVVVAVIGIAIWLGLKYNVDSERYKYLAMVGIGLLILGVSKASQYF